MARFRLLFVSVLLGASIVADAAMAAIRVNVRWTTVAQEIFPVQAVRTVAGGKTFFLENGHVVTRDHNLQAKISFNQQALMTNRIGRQYTAQYKMAGGHVVSVDRFAGAVQTVSVSTNGVNACHATVVYSRPRGARYFTGGQTSSGEVVSFSEQHAENVTCEISN